MNDQASMPIAPGASKPRRWGRWLTGAGIIGVVAAACFFAPELLRVVGFKPLVFNESWYSHKHCIKQWGVAVQVYANDHAGAFPAHPLGYAAALQLLMRPPDYNMGTYLVMGAPGGYTGKVFEVANANGTWVREADCGRVYVQGLREDSNPQIALLFDKQPSPGDHAHGWRRWNAPLRREVCLVDGSMVVIEESAWLEFARKQIELLVEAGIPRERAVALYTEKPKYTPGLTAEQLTAKP
jgi:hypothetical protein